MPILDADPTSVAMNAYADIAFADDYLTDRPDASAWNEPLLGAEVKAACLIRATQRLEAYGWKGRVTSTDQALAWPRVGTYNRNGVVYASDAVPLPIKQACAELALVMVTDSTWGGTDGLERYNSITLGGVDTFAIRHGARGGLPPSVTAIVRDLILSTQAKVLRA